MRSDLMKSGVDRIPHRALFRALGLTQEELDRGIVCASSGTHAQGVACAAHRLGARAVIVRPTHANPVKLAGVKAFGGQVELVGTLGSQREGRAAQLVEQEREKLKTAQSMLEALDARIEGLKQA